MRFSRRQALLAGASFAVWAGRAGAGEGMDATARWLAGTAALGPSSAEWLAYAHLEDERWQSEVPRLRAMHDWAFKELTPLLPADRPLFYPFAGPDALHALALFPNVPRLVLVGLEPVGALPDVSRVPPRYFERLGQAMADVHRLTFFRTHAMQSDFSRDGLVGAIVAAIVRMGGTVRAIAFGDFEDKPPSGTPKTLRVDFTSAAGASRRLDYWQLDLANFGLKSNPAAVSALRAMAPYISFLKAASFLLMEPRFGQVTKILTEDSAVLVQDDSGVPFQKLDGRFTFRFFGKYEAPRSPFEDKDQPDLRAAFEARPFTALPFGIGYRMDPKRSHLLVAVKAP